MKKKKQIISAMIVCILLLSAGCSGESDIAGTIRIGVYEPETGEDSTEGNQEIIGVRYANSLTSTIEINEETYKIDLVIADNGSDDQMGATAAENLVKENVALVIGSHGSQVTAAANGIFEDAGIPVIGMTCMDSQFMEEEQNYFSICYSTETQGEILADYAWSRGIRNVYCLAQEDDLDSQSQVDGFAGAFTALGGQVEEGLLTQDGENMEDCIRDATEMACEAIFSPISVNMADVFLDVAEKNQIQIPVFGSLNWDSHLIAEKIGESQMEVFVCSVYQAGENLQFDEGLQEWIAADEMTVKANGGNNGLSAEAALGYDAYFTAVEAIIAAASANPEDVLAALPEIVYTGVCGDIRFNAAGDILQKRMYIKKCNPQTGVWEPEWEWSETDIQS